jgi:hypothetical protein
MRTSLLAAVIAISVLATGCLTTTGSPCETDADCVATEFDSGAESGVLCLTESDGFPDGYCTVEDCAENGCDLSSECFAVELDSGRDLEICLALCDINGECDRSGYDCYEVDGDNVCLPEDGVGSDQAPAGTVGSSCSADSECTDSGGVCLTNFDGGYCSVSCDGGGCPDGAHCEAQGSSSFCFRSCENNDACRFGYECSSVDLSAPSCVPGDDRFVKNPNGASDGASCVSDINCRGGVCIRASEGYPDGYCTTVNCGSSSDCNGGSCINDGNGTRCKASCNSDAECRSGYSCASSVCNPVSGGSNPDLAGTGEFEIDCQSGDTINFTVPDGSAGFYIAPFTSGEEIVPAQLSGNGVNIDLKNDYDFYSLNPLILVSIAPMLFPGSDQPALEGNRSNWGGSWSMEFDTSANEVCYYIIPSASPGTTIDVNFYLVGVSGISASNAENNSNIRSMVSAVDTIYQKAGISLGTVRYKELGSSDTLRFQIIRDFNDVFELVQRSSDPGTTRDDLLSVNVFLIRDFNIPEIPGLLGISPGLPGVSGFHGSLGTGLVFSSVNLNSSPSDLGQTMAHEIGHFLGLRHTTEHGGGGDPITDTKVCSDPQKGTRCDDHQNFMFPFSISGVKQEQVSNGQQYVLQRSALVK